MPEVWIVEREDELHPCASCALIPLVLIGFPLVVYLIVMAPPFNNGEWGEVGECPSAAIAVAPVSGRFGNSLLRAAEKLSMDPSQGKPHPGRALPRRLGMAMVDVYRRRLSPRLPIRCPYRPSCSAYGYEAIKRYGLIQGIRIILHRLSRCSHTVIPGTRDPLP